MNASNWAVGLALLVGSIRAVELWRRAPRVDVVNVVVLNALAEGRGRELGELLRKVGSAPYFEVARAIAWPVDELFAGGERELRQKLERKAMVALAGANRALRRFAWLDSTTLVAMVFAGITAALDGRASFVLALELVAASLLWLANVRATRSIATRMVAGSEALVDGIVRSLDMIREATKARPEGLTGNLHHSTM